ncbi:MAG: NAD(P)-dependent alcohol dehydrogenase [Polyangiaceae bacterium]|nr:NAD(P)-dependent alcohol dehydrogenase [Polyangiaceae bacterium]
MKALMHHRYGGPELLTIGEREPPALRPREVLVRVRASSVNAADWLMMTGSPWPLRFMIGLTRPTRQCLGLDVAGEVVRTGSAVTSLAPGDAVFGECRGAFAELAVAHEEQLAKKPGSVSFEDVSTLPVAGTTALQGLRDKANVGPGHRVLINGASGGVGSFAIQIGHALGAEVTAVCSQRNAAAAQRLGAAHVIDYRERDFSETDERYDTIFDLIGKTPLQRCLRVLTANGRYVSSVGRLGWVFKAGLMSLCPRSRVRVLSANANTRDLETLASLIEQEKITPLIEHRYTFDRLPEALRRQGQGHAGGKSVVVV